MSRQFAPINDEFFSIDEDTVKVVPLQLLDFDRMSLIAEGCYISHGFRFQVSGSTFKVTNLLVF